MVEGIMNLDFWIGFLCGALFFIWFMWGLHKRLIQRFASIDSENQLVRKYENQRDAEQLGRTDEVAENAGPAAEIGGLFGIRPGAMTLSHLQQKKIAERVDTQQD